MWDANSKKLAIKVIATVESNIRYDAINYNDPITVGISQWYGTRAAHLLQQMQATASWVGVASSLDADLSNVAYTNADFWTDRFLLRHEGDSLKAVLTSDDGVQIQNAQTIADLETYRTRAARANLDADINTDAFIYWAQLYHQSPRYALQVLSAAGDAPTMARLHTMALNHQWYRNFKTRLNTAKAIIESGDNSGIPDFGVPVTDTDEGGDVGTNNPIPPPATAIEADIKHVMVVGDQIHIVFKDKRTLICYPTGNGYSWLPNLSSQSGTPIAPPTPEPNPTTPPSAGTTATQDALVAFLVARIDKYYYSQDPGRHTPDESGYTDCSGLVRYAYKKVAGIEVGTWTVDQQNYGDVVWSNLPGNSFGAQPEELPPFSVMQKGDLVFFSRDWTYTRVRHVEMYMGSDNGNKLIGWGGPTKSRPYPKGPYIKENPESYMEWYRWIIVRRYL